ncbi:hypothetical protein [Streptomyces beihaiensis]|uniref:hypothetical protein n=1 Tax=Streptomyces beihaiensis TaxID=2984495 RepID=UPI002B1CB415|nr:hypothetical protein [Streptomyces beihaiensis]
MAGKIILDCGPGHDDALAMPLTHGMTVAGPRSPAPADCRTRVAVGLDHGPFRELAADALVRIGDPTDSGDFAA